MKRAEIESLKAEARAIVRRLVAEYQAANRERYVNKCINDNFKLANKEAGACARMNDAIAASNYIADAEMILDYLGFVED